MNSSAECKLGIREQRVTTGTASAQQIELAAGLLADLADEVDRDERGGTHPDHMIYLEKRDGIFENLGQLGVKTVYQGAILPDILGFMEKTRSIARGEMT